MDLSADTGLGSESRVGGEPKAFPGFIPQDVTPAYISHVFYHIYSFFYIFCSSVTSCIQNAFPPAFFLVGIPRASIHSCITCALYSIHSPLFRNLFVRTRVFSDYPRFGLLCPTSPAALWSNSSQIVLQFRQPWPLLRTFIYPLRPGMNPGLCTLILSNSRLPNSATITIILPLLSIWLLLR